MTAQQQYLVSAAVSAVVPIDDIPSYLRRLSDVGTLGVADVELTPLTDTGEPDEPRTTRITNLEASAGTAAGEAMPASVSTANETKASRSRRNPKKPEDQTNGDPAENPDASASPAPQPEAPTAAAETPAPANPPADQPKLTVEEVRALATDFIGRDAANRTVVTALLADFKVKALSELKDRPADLAGVHAALKAKGA